ncbi:MAG: hypothetical protein M3N56_02110 [Actinomycetota bacterium]|nr:hypothetical protein [Actinomycetota bacterium]
MKSYSRERPVPRAVTPCRRSIERSTPGAEANDPDHACARPFSRPDRAMKPGDRLVVLASKRRGEMIGVTRDGRVLVRVDGDPEPVALAAHAVEESWILEGSWL